MVQAANVAVRCDPRMRALYEKKTRRHNYNVAMTQVATKMLKILWHMLRDDRLTPTTVFECPLCAQEDYLARSRKPVGWRKEASEVTGIAS